MKEFDVTIKATVTKTYRVRAENEGTATELAHENFSVLNDDIDEIYTQYTERVEEVEEK